LSPCPRLVLGPQVLVLVLEKSVLDNNTDLSKLIACIQTETAIRHSWRPRGLLHCHALWRSCIRCVGPKGMESAAGAFTGTRGSWLLQEGIEDLSSLHPVVPANCLDTTRPCNDFMLRRVRNCRRYCYCYSNAGNHCNTYRSINSTLDKAFLAFIAEVYALYPVFSSCLHRHCRAVYVSVEPRLHAALVSAAKVMRCIQCSLVKILDVVVPPL